VNTNERVAVKILKKLDWTFQREVDSLLALKEFAKKKKVQIPVPDLINFQKDF
jgi:hypothetical protein